MFTNTEVIPESTTSEISTEPLPRLAHRWACPECGNRIILHVRVQYAPVCHNKAAHSSRRIEMRRQRKETPK